MRIAVVVHGYPPTEVAGVELVAKEQADALAARGHLVSVFARTHDPSRADGDFTDESVDGILVRRVVSNGARPGFLSSIDHHALDGAWREFLARHHPDVVHVQHLVLLAPSLIPIARDAGAAVVVSLHDAYYLCHRLFLLDRDGRRCPGPDRGERCVSCLDGVANADEARGRYDVMARALGAADALVAPSHALARRYVDAMPFLDGRISVVDPGIRAPVVPLRTRRRDGTDEHEPVRLSFIGTWLPHKGLDLLIDALVDLDPSRWRLTVHGDGVAGREAYVDALRERSVHLPVTWAGPFAPDALGSVLADADALVLPSRCDESYSRVVREARAAGLAVIAPATGGPAEALRHEVDALLIEPDSLPSLRAALARLVDEPGLCARLAAAPADFRDVWDGAARLEQVLTDVAARRASASASANASSRAQQVTSDDAIVVTTTHASSVDPFSDVRATIIIPSYNHADFVVEAVQSALAQTERAIEVLVIDDGSSDDSVARLERLSDPRLVLVTQDNVGLSATLNRGLSRARGRWVKFLPSDDTLEPDCIARQLAAAEAAPGARLVLALPRVVDAAGAPLADPAPQAWFDTTLDGRDAILRGLLERNFVCAPGVLFDRDLARTVGGFDETLRIAQDYDLWLKMLPWAPCTSLRERLVRVRWHGANQSALVTPQSEAERAQVVRGALERLGLERWIELFGGDRLAPGDEAAVRGARAALATALERAALPSLAPVIERLRRTPPLTQRLRARVAGLLRGRTRGKAGVRDPGAHAAAPSDAARRRGAARREHWLIVETEVGAALSSAALLAAALAAEGARVTLAAPSGEPAVTAPAARDVRRIAPDPALLRELASTGLVRRPVAEPDERLRVVVRHADPVSIALAREARLCGARVVYDRLTGALPLGRAALDSERALIDAADDLVGASRGVVKQLATSKRPVHLLPDAAHADEAIRRARALRAIVARPTITIAVSCDATDDLAAIDGCLVSLAASRDRLGARIVVIDDGVRDDVLEELARRDEAGELPLVRNALRGRASGHNLALRATAGEVVVLLDASRRAPGTGWLEEPLEALLRDDRLLALVERGRGAGTGWAWLAPRVVLRRAGGFDESYDPRGLEDADLAERLRAAGGVVGEWVAFGSTPVPCTAANDRVAPDRAALARFRARWPSARPPGTLDGSHEVV